MSFTRLTALACAALACIAAAPPAASAPGANPVKAGVDAWGRKDFSGAVRAWRPLADRGDADAQFNMGQAYKLGRGVPADLKIAQSWYQKAAQQGHDQAQANLGLLLFQNGKQFEAMPWIRKAADRGDARAQYVLGTAMFNGDFVPQDRARAYALMTRASAQGLPPAAKNLEQMDQHMAQADKTRGIALARQMEAAAKQPNPAAMARADLPRAGSVLKPAEAVKPAPAPAAAKSAPKPAPAAAAPAAGGRWQVQLGAYNSPDAARAQWSKLGKLSALSGFTPSYQPAGKFTRLRVGPIASKSAADGVCAAAKAAGQACFPVAP